MTAASDVVVHGIPNCDTMKKARRWLTENGIEHRFHDYRKDGIDEAMLERWITTLDDWGVLINRRGMTWRKLDESLRETLDRDAAIRLMIEQPALIKRPVLTHAAQVLVGFDEARYREMLSD